jgi:hypothetical protein
MLEIEKITNGYFGESIKIDNRCLDFLNQKPIWNSPLNDADVIKKLFLSDPSLFFTWHKIDKNFNNAKDNLPDRPKFPDLNKVLRDNSNAVESFDLRRTLKTSFDYRLDFDKFIDNRKTDLGNYIVSQKKLHCISFLNALFDNSFFHSAFHYYNLMRNGLIEMDGTASTKEQCLRDDAQVLLHKIWQEHLINQQEESELFGFFYENDRIRVKSLISNGTVALDKQYQSKYDEGIYRINYCFQQNNTQAILEELEFLINKNSKESDFQKFFEKNPDILLKAFGPKYSNVHSQIILQQDKGRLIPDFFLERIDDGYCDILDLKRSNLNLKKQVRSHMNFKNAVFSVVAQLETYRNYFEDSINQNNFAQKYNLKSFRPKTIAIIGRKIDYYKDIERIKIEGLLPTHFELLTYDDIVERIKNFYRII